MSIIKKLFSSKECKVPLCTNKQNKTLNWPICEECMMNTVKRFKQCELEFGIIEDKTEYWIDYICKNIDTMVKAEQEAIDERGKDYNRDILR